MTGKWSQYSFLLNYTAMLGRLGGALVRRFSAAPLRRRVPCAAAVHVNEFHTSKATPNQLDSMISKNSAIDNSAEFVVSSLDDLANWARKGSIWPMTFGLA